MPAGPGTVLGRYRLLEKVGAGGMSDVWKGSDETLGRTVAVKVIQQPIAADPAYRERFLREARMVAALEHPNVLPVYDFGSQDLDGAEVSYLVMPLVTGGSLKSRIQGPVPPDRAVAWLSSIAAALDYAHEKGVLHRDVKPGNVLVDAHDHAILADFGLARSTEVTSNLTQTGLVLGTPAYISPEQAMGAPLDGRADEYALGIIAFELLTGRVPFMADTPLLLLQQHVATVPKPVTAFQPGLPKDVDAVIARSLSKKPEDRYPTCAAFVADLARALGLAAVTPTQALSRAATALNVSSVPGITAPASRAGDAVRRRRTLVLAASGAAVLLALGVFLLIRFSRSKSSEATTAAVARPAPAATAATSAPAPAASTTAAVPASTAAAPVEAQAPPTEPTPEPKRSVPTAPVPRARPERILPGAALAGDTALASAYEALDNGRTRHGTLERGDFVTALGTSREVFARHPTAEARFLVSFSRAGVAYADGRNQEAWLLLKQALAEAPAAARSRTLGFVNAMAAKLGPNPGADGEWVMGLAFADVRKDLGEELTKADERAPSSARVTYARALHASAQGRANEAARLAARACQAGLREACGAPY